MNPGARKLAAALALVCTIWSQTAFAVFDAPQPLASNAADDSPSTEDFFDLFPSVAGDGNGTWISAWCTGDPSVGAMPGALGRDAVFSRSSDDGRTWSPVTVLDGYALTRDTDTAVIATSGAGTWIAAMHGDTDEIVIARSHDDGNSWTTSAPIGSYASNVKYLRIAADSHGRWVLAWQYYDSVRFWQLAAVQSEDDGLTWSDPMEVTVEGGGPSVGDFVKIATDDNGVWMLIWAAARNVLAATSFDGGKTWGVPRFPGAFRLGETSQPDIATDGLGTWIVTWDTTRVANSADFHILAAVSKDNGNSWSEASAINGPLGRDVGGQRRTSHPRYRNGVWSVVWTQALDSLASSIGYEGDLVGVRSFDDGQSWTDPAALNLNAARDNVSKNFYATPFPWKNLDFLSELATAGDTSILVWSSTNTLGGTIGEDYDVFHARDHEDCPVAPHPDCKSPTAAGASTLTMLNPQGGRDKLTWTWKSGDGTVAADLGDPTTTSDYVLCVYDEAGGTLRSVLEQDMPSAGGCRPGTCWMSSTQGYKYKDSDRRDSAVSKLSIRAGSDGDASFKLRASGPTLAPPVMPLAMAPATVAQLINLETDQCWEASFSQAEENSATAYRARSE